APAGRAQRAPRRAARPGGDTARLRRDPGAHRRSRRAASPAPSRQGETHVSYAIGAVLCAIGMLLGLLVGRRFAPQKAVLAQEEGQRLLESARTEAEQLKRDAQVESKELLVRAQRDADAELHTHRQELEREAERIAKLETAQARKAELLASREEEQGR